MTDYDGELKPFKNNSILHVSYDAYFEKKTFIYYFYTCAAFCNL